MLKGKGVSEGIGLGKAVILKNEEIKPEKIQIEDVDLEKENFYHAFHEVESEIEELINKLSGTEKDIMQAYLMILQDPTLVQETVEIIEKENLLNENVLIVCEYRTEEIKANYSLYKEKKYGDKYIKIYINNQGMNDSKKI